MTENTTELSRPLVVGRKRDGRNCYDPEAKRELVEACLEPGVSVARLALQHGVNANLLRTWIGRYRQKREFGAISPTQPNAFVAVVPVRHAPSANAELRATLPNGVKLDLNGMDANALAAMLNCLARLPCSVSTLN
ncbi:MAG: transposase [Rhodocyclaceae bacterium]|nr:transposase [Rhodocyclaceae bacterium]